MVSVGPIGGTIQSVLGRRPCLLFFILYLSTQLAGAIEAPRRIPVSLNPDSGWSVADLLTSQRDEQGWKQVFERRSWSSQT